MRDETSSFMPITQSRKYAVMYVHDRTRVLFPFLQQTWPRLACGWTLCLRCSRVAERKLKVSQIAKVQILDYIDDRIDANTKQ